MSTLDSLLPPEDASPAAGPGDDLLDRARRLADDLLAPHAEETDTAALVPRSHLEALADAGLLGISGPREYGGLAAPGPVSREVAETLAGACGVTHFVQAQHHGPVGMIASSENAALRERFLRDLCAGRILAGVAFSHLRRPQPVITARPVPGGWEVNGEAPWVTSWGLAGLFVVAASLPDDRILYFVAPGRATDTMRPSAPLPLAVMNASGTVRLAFHQHHVAKEDMVRIADSATWRARDRVNTAHVNPAVFGIAATCLRGLQPAPSSGGGAAARAAEVLTDEWDRCRAAAYRWMDTGATEADLPGVLATKAWSLDLVARAAHASIAAAGGRAMSLSHPAQRLMREAMFYTIQAQTPAVRDATLDRLATPSPPTEGAVEA